MEYTVIVNGRSYDLPKKTLGVMDEMEQISQIDSVRGMSLREKFQKIHRYVEKLVGSENAKEILGSDRIEEIDLSEITILFRKIVDSYNKPVSDYMAERSRNALDSANIDKVISLAKAANEVQKKI